MQLAFKSMIASQTTRSLGVHHSEVDKAILSPRGLMALFLDRVGPFALLVSTE